ncbi:membrane protein [Streptomyces phage Forrest]|nr:membrane protein [Streptomyces phage Forrest]QZE11577.1 membrane protein [Streptomyces phage Jada]
MKQEHNDRCHIYRGCPRCNQKDDRWEIIPVTFCILVVFTFVIPVIPAIIAIIAQVT